MCEPSLAKLSGKQRDKDWRETERQRGREKHS